MQISEDMNISRGDWAHKGINQHKRILYKETKSQKERQDIIFFMENTYIYLNVASLFDY